MPSLAFRKASIYSRFSFSASCTLVVNPQHATRSRLILYWKLPPSFRLILYWKRLLLVKWPVINDNVTFRGSCGNLSGVKWIGGYALHLCASALVVPGLTLLLVSVGFWFVHRLLDVGDSPQQFYSDYFLLMAVIVGLG